MRTLMLAIAMAATFAIAAAGSNTSAPADAECCSTQTCCSGCSTGCN